MSLGNKKPWLTRFRLAAALIIGSFLVAAGYAITQAQDDRCWSSGSDGNHARIQLAIGSLIVFLFAMLVFSLVVRTWRNLPASRKTWTWFVLISVVAGILWSSFLFWLNGERGELYSLSETLELVLLWSLVFLTGLLFLYSLKGVFRWLFSWRIVKRGLLGLVLLAGLMVLFHAEENWRGRRAWNQCRQALEAQGEKLDFAAFIPPPVPDEENFAMAPVVVSSYEAIFRRLRTHDFSANISSESRLEMRLERKYYSFPTNVIIGSWQQARPTDLKAWQEYYRVRFVTNDMTLMMPPPPWESPPPPTFPNGSPIEIVPLDTNEFPIAAEAQSPAADVLLALSRYGQTLDELQQAGQRPHSRFPANYQANSLFDVLLPHFAGLKNSAQVLQLRAVAELQAGQNTQALADVKLIFRMTDSIRSEPFWLSHLVRALLVNMAVQPIWEGLAENQWSDAELQVLMKELRQFDFAADWQFATRGERAMLIKSIDHLKTNRNEMAVILLLATFPEAPKFLDEWGRAMRNLPRSFDYLLDRFGQRLADTSVTNLIVNLPPDGWYDLNKVILAGTLQTQLIPMADPARHLISPSIASDAKTQMDMERHWRNGRPSNVLFLFFYPLASRTSQRFAQAQNAADMTLLACALERYRLAHNEYPEALSSLTPHYLEKIPPDVVNGQSLRYRRTDNGRFQLYSIGWDGKDDGGTVFLTQYGRLDQKTGDWVWQYPAKP